MPHDDRRRRFELLALPHLDAAYNLARWLAGNTADAEDVVQDAYLRAYRYFDAFQGGNFRVWLLTIVRNAFITWVKENRSGRMVFLPDTPVAETAETEATMWGSRPRDPEALLLESIDSQTLSRLMEQLPAEYREVLLLREVEDLAYKEIADRDRRADRDGHVASFACAAQPAKAVAAAGRDGERAWNVIAPPDCCRGWSTARWDRSHGCASTAMSRAATPALASLRSCVPCRRRSARTCRIIALRRVWPRGSARPWSARHCPPSRRPRRVHGSAGRLSAWPAPDWPERWRAWR